MAVDRIIFCRSLCAVAHFLQLPQLSSTRVKHIHISRTMFDKTLISMEDQAMHVIRPDPMIAVMAISNHSPTKPTVKVHRFPAHRLTWGRIIRK